jgi:hypothetical protein
VMLNLLPKPRWQLLPQGACTHSCSRSMRCAAEAQRTSALCLQPADQQSGLGRTTTVIMTLSGLFDSAPGCACRAVLPQVSEEVGLSPQQLQLVTCGRPLPVDDGQRHFLIYPLLFNLLDSAAAITLNWENVAYDWVAARWELVVAAMCWPAGTRP